MATVLKVQFTSGRIRLCDARCHNAQGDKCSCICNGKNHGVGLRQAIINSQKSLNLDPKLSLNLIMLDKKDQLDLFPESQHQYPTTPRGPKLA
ncbi:hypothetical protein ES705_38666 [subsurface metagenome]